MDKSRQLSYMISTCKRMIKTIIFSKKEAALYFWIYKNFVRLLSIIGVIGFRIGKIISMARW